MSRYVDPKRPTPYGAIFTTPVPVPVEPKPMSLTYAQIRRYVADLPDEYLFGAVQRFRDEVALPHDRLPVQILQSEGGTDFWTGDVMTGGAVGYFVRAYIPEFLIAVHQGANALDASVAGFNAAKAAYNAGPGRGRTDEETGGEPGPFGEIRGRLRVTNGRLANDAGYFNHQGVSAFCAIGHVLQGRTDEMLRQLRRNARAGRNVQRVFCMLRPTNGNFGPVQPFVPEAAGWVEAARNVVDSAAALGMYTQLNIFADCSVQFGALYHTHEDRLRVLRLVAHAFKHHPAVYFRLANEPYQNGWSGPDDPQILEFADELAGILGHRDFAIGDVKDDGSESGAPHTRAAVRAVAARSNILVTHPDREEQHGRERPIEHMKSVYEYLRDEAERHAIIFDEPRGFASQRVPGRRDNRGAVAVAEACTAAILGCGYTYHRIAEQDDAAPGLDESRIALQIPVDPSYRYANAGLGESWVEHFDGFYKVRTCSNGTEGWAIGHGPSGNIVGRHAAERVFEITSDGLNVVLFKGRA